MRSWVQSTTAPQKQNTLKPKGLRKEKVRNKEQIYSFVLINLSNIYIFFWDRVSLCCYGWPEIQYVDQVGLKVTGICLPLPTPSARLLILKLRSLGKTREFCWLAGSWPLFLSWFLGRSALPINSLSFLCDKEPEHEWLHFGLIFWT